MRDCSNQTGGEFSYKSALAVTFLFLSATDLYRIISYALNSASFVATGCLFFLGLIVIFISRDEVLYVVKIKKVFFFIVFVFLVPLMINIFWLLFLDISQVSLMRDVVVEILSLMVFLIAFILLIALQNHFYLVSFCSLLVGSLAVIHQTFFPEFYRIIANLSGVDSPYVVYGSELGRFFGFYMDQNRAGLSLVLLLSLVFVGKVLNKLRISNFSFIVVVVVCIYAILLTGSRASLVATVCVTSLFFLCAPSFKNINFEAIYRILFLFFGLAMSLMIFFFASQFLNSIGLYELAGRFDNLTEIVSGRELGPADESWEARVAAQKVYFEYILASPVLGYGAQYARYLLDAGMFLKPSHNQLIEMTFSYGIFYVLFMVFLYFRVLTAVCREHSYRFLVLLMFFLPFFYAMALNTLMLNKNFYLILGVLLYVAVHKDSSYN
jgi:hypothetical protein